MAVQNPYLTTDGDLNQAKRKRAGETVGIGDQLPGDPARAARMEAQYTQPVTQVKTLEAQAGSGGSGGIGGAVERIKKAYSVVSPLINPVGTAADVLTAAPADALRNSVIRAAGGDPATAQGGESANVDRAYGNLMPAVKFAGSIADTVSQGVKGGVLAATGASPAPKVQTPPSIAAPVQPAAAQGQAQQQLGRQSAQPTDSPYYTTDSGIAARRNENGIMEFSNAQNAVAGAQAMPAGGIGGQQLRTPGFSNIGDDVPLERRGSINNLGNGIGGFSQNTQGDAALALGRFERAGVEREKMIQASRRGGIGEGGGRVTIVKDSSRTPTLQERQLSRFDNRQAQTDALRAQTEQGILAGADQLMTSQLNRQKTQQELAAGQYGVQDRQRIAELQARMIDPALSEQERSVAREAYTALSTQAKDRYQSQDLILGRDENGRDIRGTQLIDVTTGRPVMGIGDTVPQRNAAPAVGSRQGGYEFIGGDPSDKNSWRKV